MTIEIWLLLTILVALIVITFRIYGRIEELRQYKYQVAQIASHNDSDETWRFILNINTEIPIVLGQIITVEPSGIRADSIITNQDLSTTIHYEIKFDDLQGAYKYMADLLYYGHWKFSPIFDQKLPKEVEILVKEHV